MKHKLWRKAQGECCPETGYYWISNNSTLCNGALHWIANFRNGALHWTERRDRTERRDGNKNIVLAFDLAKEKYHRHFEVPISCEYAQCNDPFIFGVLKGCFSLCFQGDIWTMKEYGIEESWTKICTMREHVYLGKRVCFSQLENVIVICGGYRYMKCDLDKNTCEVAQVFGDKFNSFAFSMSCLCNTESLLCPDLI
ncbi:hypothetical protein ACFE04_016100 [Oxalis oulophora]